ncbi:MAG TPA: hypothetical protein VJ952_12295 [Opitutales bacterium]|nr:hypothetical protein [Opitutales bacterium]
MASAYSLVYSEQAADFLIALERSRLISLLYDLRVLAKSPFMRSDYVLNDSQGRSIDHLLIGDFVVAFWADHALSELRIVEISDVS